MMAQTVVPRRVPWSWQGRGSRSRTRVIAVTGGKGGVGKSSITANLAVHYANRGSRVLVLDADLGMADLNLLFGVAPERSLLDVLLGVPVEHVLVPAHGIHLLPGLNASTQLANLALGERRALLDAVDTLSQEFDTLLIDCAPGLSENALGFAAAAMDVVLVVTPDSTSLADAYACAKVLATEHGVRRMHVLPNVVRSGREGTDVVEHLVRLTRRFLEVSLSPLPAIPFDPKLEQAGAHGVPLMCTSLEAPASRALVQVARRLDGSSLGEDRSGAIQLFWRRALEGLEAGLEPQVMPAWAYLGVLEGGKASS